MTCWFANAVGTAVFAQQSAAIPAELVVDFNRDIRPILSDHCFNCHGPDANTLQAGLRLDQEESVFAAAESGNAPVVRGDIGASELIKRIASSDPNDVMPPPDFDKPISPIQADLLRRWIEQGANWSGHWAFESVRVPTVPTQDLAAGIVHNAIDSFVLAKLKSEGLSQSPLESRDRLIRRVSLDLTGLPPSVREVEDFLADGSPNAFETVVDRLLASQHFGERLAIPWLDLARYGDTSGYHNDSLRDMWLWRQWVIESFNANMPFDQFT
ncbi:MAG TPA: chromosome segregation protein, partial [Planctomycetaceae bacterium]|nr:chromosome segregation protein [Planctomycetaceae bacterium]